MNIISPLRLTDSYSDNSHVQTSRLATSISGYARFGFTENRHFSLNGRFDQNELKQGINKQVVFLPRNIDELAYTSTDVLDCWFNYVQVFFVKQADLWLMAASLQKSGFSMVKPWRLSGEKLLIVFYIEGCSNSPTRNMGLYFGKIIVVLGWHSWMAL